MVSWLKFAMKLTNKSTHPRYRHASVIVRGGRVLSHAANTGRRTRHAELRSIDRAADLTGATLYSVRDPGGCSRPCPRCERAIREAGIARVVYYDCGGNVVSEEYV